MGKLRTIKTEVMVASAQRNLTDDRMRVCAMLWDAGLKVWSCAHIHTHITQFLSFLGKVHAELEIQFQVVINLRLTANLSSGKVRDFL